jgi:hypothetical protein
LERAIAHDAPLAAIKQHTTTNSRRTDHLASSSNCHCSAGAHNPTIPLGLHVAAHLLTHMFLSPLELLRTRLIVQPSSDPKSKSSIGLLRESISEEGGVAKLYTHPQLFIPALLEHTLRPIFTLSIPLIIERRLGITPDGSPITYQMLDLSLGLASLLVILPIETVRKRLQLQDRMSSTEVWQRGGKREKRKSVVRLRKREYYGLVDTIWRIVTEETGVPKKKRSKRRASRTEHVNPVDEHEKQRAAFDGIKQLYRGVSAAVVLGITDGYLADPRLVVVGAVRYGCWRPSYCLCSRTRQRRSGRPFDGIRMEGDLVQFIPHAILRNVNQARKNAHQSYCRYHSEIARLFDPIHFHGHQISCYSLRVICSLCTARYSERLGVRYHREPWKDWRCKDQCKKSGKGAQSRSNDDTQRKLW